LFSVARRGALCQLGEVHGFERAISTSVNSCQTVKTRIGRAVRREVFGGQRFFGRSITDITRGG